ncbi:hypothetical protein CONPUDRAFT_157405 [Coniophora puteana RWD-64-598 SS2]|uniref:Uncharacterized protein n=1 Tax=Coniophora puteana (strain RWD-64-598) TaxID=741705 RepID=A0A5M3MDL9_CONPW|nr:uncharacterized protein CONPUDRAFT_157405 [Coniophora puteana RWD-64-598 SS2]EIW77137.1 hypothetical protein CONPUDRAFT_157405 [Coniophora puteana RWD-64-598 SS2]
MLYYCHSEGCGIALEPKLVLLATGSDKAKANNVKERKEWDAKDLQAREKIDTSVQECFNNEVSKVKDLSLVNLYNAILHHQVQLANMHKGPGLLSKAQEKQHDPEKHPFQGPVASTQPTQGVQEPLTPQPPH